MVGAPVAHADSQDDRYLAALAGQGITGQPDQLIADGHAACDNYGTPGLAGQMTALEGRGLTNLQASNLLVTGMRAYCAEKESPRSAQLKALDRVGRARLDHRRQMDHPAAEPVPRRTPARPRRGSRRPSSLSRARRRTHHLQPMVNCCSERQRHHRIRDATASSVDCIARS